MPEYVKNHSGREYPIATETELIEFCNKVREAGGADPISALFPSTPDEPESCLIARALNFSCEVNGPYDAAAWADKLKDDKKLQKLIQHAAGGRFTYKDTQESIWVMLVQHGNHEDSAEKAKEVAEKLGLHYVIDEILLPREIGNSAQAFDNELAFTEYNTTVIQREEWALENEYNEEEENLDD